MPSNAPIESQPGPDDDFNPTANTDDAPAEDNTSASTSAKKRKSAAGRKLMRWDPSVDQLVLLVMDAVCAQNGIPLPWDEVASAIQPWMTGEAIKQHLVKLRRARESVDLPVPAKVDKAVRRKSAHSLNNTPARKGGNDDLGEVDGESISTLLYMPSVKGKKKINTRVTPAKNPKTPKSNKGGKKSQNDGAEDDEEDESAPSTTKKSTGKRGAAGSARKNRVEDDDEEETPSKRVKPNTLRKRAAVNYKEQLEDGEDEEEVEDMDANIVGKVERGRSVYKRDVDEDDEGMGSSRDMGLPFDVNVKQEQTSSSTTNPGLDASASPFYTGMPMQGSAAALRNFSYPIRDGNQGRVGQNAGFNVTTSSSDSANGIAAASIEARGGEESTDKSKLSSVLDDEEPFFGSTDPSATGNHIFADRRPSHNIQPSSNHPMLGQQGGFNNAFMRQHQGNYHNAGMYNPFGNAMGMGTGYQHQYDMGLNMDMGMEFNDDRTKSRQPRYMPPVNMGNMGNMSMGQMQNALPFPPYEAGNYSTQHGLPNKFHTNQGASASAFHPGQSQQNSFDSGVGASPEPRFSQQAHDAAAAVEAQRQQRQQRPTNMPFIAEDTVAPEDTSYELGDFVDYDAE